MSNQSEPDLQFHSLKQAASQLSSYANQICQQIEQEQVLSSIIDRIRASLDLETIFNTTSTEIRQLLNVDRVGVFRFTPGSGWNEGEFVAEDVAPEFPSALVAKVYDHCFGTQFAIHYAQGRVQAVSDIYHAGLSDCHIQVLAQFQVRANLIVPVLKGADLWGLLCIHQCSHSRKWQHSEIGFIQKIASYFAIALQQSEQAEQLKQQGILLVQAEAQRKALLRQQALFKITNRIRRSLDFNDICQTATQEVCQLLMADRVVIYRFKPDCQGEFCFESIADHSESSAFATSSEPVVRITETLRTINLSPSDIRIGMRDYASHKTVAISDISTLSSANPGDFASEFLDALPARAYAITSIFEGDHLWGLLIAFQKIAPRLWTEDEMELLAQIGEQLSITLQQSESVRQIQAQSVQLQQLLEELQKSQAQLIQNEKMAGLGQLVAGVAHEINNPVNFIYGNLSHVHEYVNNLLSLIHFYQQVNPISPSAIEALKERAEAIELEFILEDLPKTLASMRIGADRIRQMVLSLRNFSRLDESAYKTVNVHEGIRSTLVILGHQVATCSDRHKVNVIETYGDIPPIECYPAQLNQVFMNLISNALDALKEAIDRGHFSHPERADRSGPTIWISTQCCKPINGESVSIEIRIRDNGIGMEAETQDKVFDHFFTTKPIGKGTGLGLAIARQIVCEKHGGSLGFTSQPGEGTEFVIRLPIVLPSQQSVG